MKYFNLLMLSTIFFSVACQTIDKPELLQVVSPEAKAKVKFALNEAGQPYYIASYNDMIVLDTSYLGFELMDGSSLKEGFEVVSSSTNSVDETWEQPWGEQQFIRDYHNELKISLQEKAGLKRKLDIVFRVFDDGIGFRYEFPEQENLKDFEVKDELTEFNMTKDHAAWWVPAYAHNRYEYLYEKTPLSEMGDEPRRVHTPVTFESEDGIYISLHEASLVDYSSMAIDATSGTKLKCDLIPYQKGSDMRAKVSAPGKTPWRTIQLAEKPGDLITSYLILNLNEPNKLGDVSWFKPGKYVGIWWEIHLDYGTWVSGERHAANTANTKKYIDFAAEHGFQGVLVEGWNQTWDGDWTKNGDIFSFTKPYPDYDLEELAAYGNEKGVYLVSHHETAGNIDNYGKQLEEAFQLMEDMGQKAVKTGYVEHGGILSNGKMHHGQAYIDHFREVIKTGARHKAAIVAHEPIKPTGERRTYPNMISSEGARGQEFNAWSADGGNPPSHTAIIPFTRLLGGPMDFTPGVFDIKLPKKPNNQVNTTLAKQLALYVTIYSPMQMACDLPENYMKYPDAFQFIKEVGVDWETTKVLDASIGEHLTVARKEKGTGDWFVGTLTNEEPREIKFNLDFLDAGKQYVAKIYRDGDNAHYIDNPEDYAIEEIEVSSNDEIALWLAASGGAAIKISLAD